MKSLPSTLVLAKNLLSNTSPWYLILDVEITTGTYIYLVKNTEAITYNGNSYTPFPFEVGVNKHTSKGEVPTIQFRICNINRVMQAYLEEYDGLIGNAIVMRLVNDAYLTEDYSELTLSFDVLSCTSTFEWVTFDCGAPNPMRKRFPLHRYIGNHCRFTFKSLECGYEGSGTECNRTYSECEALGNTIRFGGFKGLVGGGIRLA